MNIDRLKPATVYAVYIASTAALKAMGIGTP